MGATSENFCLRWNDFETNVSGAFRELRAERDFFDVTLCCSDSEGRNLQAHKVILSACSSFFKNMLRQQSAQSNHPNPFIFLRGVSYSDLLSVLDFMYHGEVNVAQEDLNSFLSVAEELQIKGLTNKDGTSTGSEPSKKSSQKTSIPPAKRPRPASMSNAPKPSEEGPEEKPDIKSDPEAGPSSQAVTDYEGGEDQEAEEDYGNDEEFQESYYEDNGGDMLDQDMNQEDGDGTGKAFKRRPRKIWRPKTGRGDEVPLVVPAGVDVMHFLERIQSTRHGEMLVCKLCDKIGKRTDNMRRHMVIHAEPTNEECPYCGRTYKNRPTLRVHMMTCSIKKGP